MALLHYTLEAIENEDMTKTITSLMQEETYQHI